jgi:NTP pyrophosphatase (non-canonical NTP hydrolase)
MKNYKELALKTDHKNYQVVVDRIDKSKARLLHATLGLTTEASEFADPIKANIIYGKPLDIANLKEELGDMFWFLNIACDELGFTFEELQELNIKKLKARYGDKFSSDKAINRDLEKEKEILNNN